MDPCTKFEKITSINYIDTKTKYIDKQGLSKESLKETLIIIVQSLSCRSDNISSDSLKVSKKPHAITLCDFIQIGCRTYGSSKDEKKLAIEMKKMGISSEETIKLFLSIMKKHKKTINQEISYSSQSQNTDLTNTSVISSNSKKISHNLGYGFVSYPHFQQLRWRLDVTISNSNLKRVLKPYLVLRCEY